MYINKSDPKNDEVIIILDGKWCRGAVAANSDEGWVEILDPNSFPPIDLDEPAPEISGSIEEAEVEDYTPFTELKTKKVYGKVEFIGRPK